MTINAMRETPVYRAATQVLIEKDAPTVATLDQMFQSQDGWSNDDFSQTQYRILQSRTLAKQTIDAMKLWDAPRLGNGPEPKSKISITALPFNLLNSGIRLVKRPFAKDEPPTAAAPVAGRAFQRR